MLSFRKLTMPIPNVNSSKSTISTRCRRAKAIMEFISTAPRSVAAGGAVNEQRAAGHDLFAGGQTLEHLDHPVGNLTDADGSGGNCAILTRHPDASRIALIDDRALWHSRGGRGLARDDAKISEHPG